jgi:hypothetical protein
MRKKRKKKHSIPHVDKGLLQIKTGPATNPKTQKWIKDVEHYQALTLKVGNYSASFS